LLVDLLHGHAATEHRSNGEVAAVTGVARSHHVLCVEHLLRELRHGQGAILLATSTGEGGESGHEEVKTWERNHVNGEFTQIGIQLT